MNAIEFKKWLEARRASCTIGVQTGIVYCSIFRPEHEVLAESSDLEDAIRCAQHLYDAEVYRP